MIENPLYPVSTYMTTSPMPDHFRDDENDALMERLEERISVLSNAAFREGVEWALSHDWGWDSDSLKQRPDAERMSLRPIDWSVVDRLRAEEER